MLAFRLEAPLFSRARHALAIEIGLPRSRFRFPRLDSSSGPGIERPRVPLAQTRKALFATRSLLGSSGVASRTSSASSYIVTSPADSYNSSRICRCCCNSVIVRRRSYFDPAVSRRCFDPAVSRHCFIATAAAAAAMASDGGPVTASISVTPADVDKAADEILVYWFGDFMAPGYAGPPPADDDVAAKQPLWFRKDADVDAFISARFAPLIPLAASGQLAGWEDTPRGALALVVLLDQFTRNSFRGSPDSFAQDVLARDVAKRAIAKGFNTQFHLRIRSFFYMPFMHSEDLPDQDLCVQLFLQSVAEAPEGPLKESLAQWVQFAHKHRDIIVKFGRFPHRNEVLGRESTAEEVEHVATHGGF